MNFPAFIKNVWNWKYLGSYIWSFSAYFCYSIYVILFSSFSGLKKNGFILCVGFILIFPDFYTYFLCLTVIPARHTILSLVFWFKRVIWFITHTCWLFVVLYSFLSFKSAIYVALIESYILTSSLTFTVFVFPKKIIRIAAIKLVYQFPLVPIIYVCIFSSFFAPIKYLLHIGTLYILSDFLAKIWSIIASEPICFDSSDNKRLATGMQETGITQYWAYIDLYQASIDRSKSRREMFYHSNGICWDSVGKQLIQLFRKYSEAHSTLYDEFDAQKYPLHRLWDGSLNSDNRYHIREIKNQSSISPADMNPTALMEEQRKMKQIQNSYLRKAGYIIRTAINDRHKLVVNQSNHYRAVADSVIIIQAIKAFTSLVSKAHEEDQFGVIQVLIEQIIDQMLSISRHTKNSVHIVWAKYDFGDWKLNDPLACDMQGLTRAVLITVRSSLEFIFKNYGKRLDLSKISSDNLDEAQFYLEN